MAIGGTVLHWVVIPAHALHVLKNDIWLVHRWGIVVFLASTHTRKYMRSIDNSEEYWEGAGSTVVPTSIHMECRSMSTCRKLGTYQILIM